MTTLRVGNIEALGGTGTITVPSGNKINQAGSVLQVVSITKTDVFTSTSTTWTDITGLSASITPFSSSSKVLVLASVSFNFTGGAAAANLKLVRGSTDIYIGDAAGSRPRASSFTRDYPNTGNTAILFLDSPNTSSSTTYKFQGFVNASNRSFTINRGYGDDDTSAFDARTASTITLMEIAS